MSRLVCDAKIRERRCSKDEADSSSNSRHREGQLGGRGEA